MMLDENAALYRQLAQNVKLPKPMWNWFFCVLALISSALTMSVGCIGDQSKTSNTPANEPTGKDSGSKATASSTVPLRVWFVANGTDKPIIERQWEATFDRPIDVRVFTGEELLAQPKADCDTLVYPAWMIGELISRKWIVELPSKLQSTEPANTDEGQAAPQPAAWLEQTRYDRKLWGLSLSVITPVIMANFEIPAPRTPRPEDTLTAEESIAYWQSLIEALKSRQEGASNSKPADGNQADNKAVSEADALAVCDRFMTILFSVSNNENRIGALMHPDDLAPRVLDENFRLAAKIMSDLQAASGNAHAWTGSHSSAWQTLMATPPTITISLPPTPSPDVDKVNTIHAQSPPSNPIRSGIRATAGWNSGRGLIVSISRQCRQSAASIEFARWLASDSSRQGFAKRIAGIAAESAYAPSSSAWQAQRIVQRLGQQVRIPAEPRLPLSQAYRQSLGEELISMLQGKSSIEEAMSAIDKSWREITAKTEAAEQVAAYRKSLGL